MPYMRKFWILSLLLSILLIEGCASDPKEIVPEPCYDMAKYAKSIAFLMEAGIPVSEVDSYTKVPVAIAVPMYALQAQVAARKYANPGEAYSEVLDQCKTVGWTNMLVTLETRFPRYGLRMSTSVNIKKKSK